MHSEVGADVLGYVAEAFSQRGVVGVFLGWSDPVHEPGAEGIPNRYRRKLERSVALCLLHKRWQTASMRASALRTGTDNDCSADPATSDGFTERPAWRSVGAGWQHLHSSFRGSDASFEWHDFKTDNEFD